MAEEKKGMFGAAKAKPAAKSKKDDKESVIVPGYEQKIKEYQEIGAQIADLEALQKGLSSELKDLGKEKFLELYKRDNANPNTFLIKDGDGCFMFLPMDKYVGDPPSKGIDEERADRLKAEYGDIITKDEKYYFNGAVLERNMETIETLLMGSPDITDADKESLIQKDVKYSIKKGTIDNLAKYGDKMSTVIDEIQIQFQVKTCGGKMADGGDVEEEDIIYDTRADDYYFKNKNSDLEAAIAKWEAEEADKYMAGGGKVDYSGFRNGQQKYIKKIIKGISEQLTGEFVNFGSGGNHWHIFFQLKNDKWMGFHSGGDIITFSRPAKTKKGFIYRLENSDWDGITTTQIDLMDYLEETGNMGYLEDIEEYMSGGGSIIRANNSPTLRYANFEDNWHINLLELNPYRNNQSGLRYKGGNKYAVTRVSPKSGQEVFEFKTLEDAENKFNKLVELSKTFSPIRFEGKTPRYPHSHKVANKVAKYLFDNYDADSYMDHTEFINKEIAVKFNISTEKVEEIVDKISKERWKYAEGGGFGKGGGVEAVIYEVYIDRGNSGTETIADFENKKDAVNFIYEYSLKHPKAKLGIDTLTSDYTNKYAKGSTVKGKDFSGLVDFANIETVSQLEKKLDSLISQKPEKLEENRDEIENSVFYILDDVFGYDLENPANRKDQIFMDRGWDTVAQQLEYVKTEIIPKLKKELGTNKYAKGSAVKGNSDTFKEIIDLGDESYFVRNWGYVSTDRFDKIELVAVATIRDLESYLSEDELPKEGNFELNITIVPIEKYLSKKHTKIANDDNNSMSSNTIVNIVNYMGGLNYSPNDKSYFKTFEEVEEYLLSKELNDKISAQGMMSGFILDNKYNRAGQSNWDYLAYMTGERERFENGGVPDLAEGGGLNSFQSLLKKYNG